MGRAVIPDAPVRVLYVDGDSDYADRVWSSLDRESLPFDVQTAPDAECALEHLRASDDVHCIVSEYQLPDTTGLVFYVEDDGPGISPDERASVFDSSHTTKTEGTGLGLAIVEKVAKGHGWSVCVTEGTGGGARFEFTDIETVSEAL